MKDDSEAILEWARAGGLAVNGKVTAQQLAVLENLKFWDENKTRPLEPFLPPAAGKATVNTGIGEFTIYRDKFGRGSIQKYYVIRRMKRALLKGDYASFCPSHDQIRRDAGAVLFDNAKAALDALVSARRKDMTLYRALLAQTGAAYMAGFWYAVEMFLALEREARIGKKQLLTVRSPRKPSAKTVPGMLAQIKGSSKIPIAKLVVLISGKRKQDGLPEMDSSNIERQIRKARARLKKADSKA